MNYQDVDFPKHIGLIMDGNGRWAIKHRLNRSLGHKAGYDNLQKLNKYIFARGVKVLSIYALSTENFKRPKEEINYILELFLNFFMKEKEFYIKNNIKVIFSGRRENFSNKVLDAMDIIIDGTKNNTKAIYNICFNYSGQNEIIDACTNLIKEKVTNLDSTNFQKYLYHDLPPIDFLIRTSGEQRLSNFMLWQAAYAELYFTKVLFPDFDCQEFDKAINIYNKRIRKFGGIL
ncbi:MAG: polyprenyl diphosphate synthase [Bacilli bacterium]